MTGAWLVGIFVVLIILAIVIGLPVYTYAGYHHKQDLTCTVNDKDRTSDSKGNSHVRIYTDQCGVLTVQDAMFYHNFHSADTYAKIQPGHTYEFHTIGFRVPFLSDFPNIVQVEEIK